ncbi:MAG TPA: hypothetical protein VF145_00355 [Chitinophagaceae bacterium]
MKTSTIAKARVDAELLNAIQQEVKETIAVDVALPQRTPKFGVADLWKIHRARRQKATRRFL